MKLLLSESQVKFMVSDLPKVAEFVVTGNGFKMPKLSRSQHLEMVKIGKTKPNVAEANSAMMNYYFDFLKSVGYLEMTQ